MNTTRPNWKTRATMLYFKLNADRMCYTPLSHRGMRAARLMPKLHAAMAKGDQS